MARNSKVKKSGSTACEYCNNFVWDEEDEQYYCEMDMDEDDYKTGNRSLQRMSIFRKWG